MDIAYLYAKIMDRLRGKAVIGCQIDKTAVVNPGCNIVGSAMGRYSYCGHDCQIVNTEIGAFCSISDHVFIGGAEHPMEWISTSPVFQNTRHSGPTRRFAKKEVPVSRRTIVGNDVWIGHGVTVKSGVTIGDGAVIGSNALVTKDVPPYAIVGGVPARVIRYRFDEKERTLCQECKWWLLKEDELKQISGYIDKPMDFIKEIKKLKGENWGV